MFKTQWWSRCIMCWLGCPLGLIEKTISSYKPNQIYLPWGGSQYPEKCRQQCQSEFRNESKGVHGSQWGTSRSSTGHRSPALANRRVCGWRRTPCQLVGNETENGGEGCWLTRSMILRKVATIISLVKLYTGTRRFSHRLVWVDPRINVTINKNDSL